MFTLCCEWGIRQESLEFYQDHTAQLMKVSILVTSSVDYVLKFWGNMTFPSYLEQRHRHQSHHRHHHQRHRLVLRFPPIDLHHFPGCKKHINSTAIKIQKWLPLPPNPSRFHNEQVLKKERVLFVLRRVKAQIPLEPSGSKRLAARLELSPLFVAWKDKEDHQSRWLGCQFIKKVIFQYFVRFFRHLFSTHWHSLAE